MIDRAPANEPGPLNKNPRAVACAALVTEFTILLGGKRKARRAQTRA